MADNTNDTTTGTIGASETPQAASVAQLAAQLTANTETGPVTPGQLTPIGIDEARTALEKYQATLGLYADSTAGMAETAGVTDGWKPAFNDTVRTIIYVVCFILGIVGGVLSIVAVTAGAPAWAVIASVAVAWIAPQTASAFGVAYNPIRLNNETSTAKHAA